MTKPYLNRFAKRRDANEPEIVSYFESRGISVHRLDKPLDLLLGYNKKNYLVEIKVLGKNLNDNQVKFTQEWKGQWFLCRSLDQAARFADEITNKGE